MSEGTFSAEERRAMAERAAELREARGLKGAAKAAREYQACLDAIDSLTGLDRQIAERLHTIAHEVAPDLAPKTWYGFPSYARDGQVVVFFQPAAKFATRYGTVGFTEHARLDDGPMWATSFAVAALTDEVVEQLQQLVQRA